MAERDSLKKLKDEYLAAFGKDSADQRWTAPIASRVALFFHKNDIKDSQIEDLAAMVLAWLEVRRGKGVL